MQITHAPCVFCDGHPINHAAAWTTATLEVLAGKVTRNKVTRTLTEKVANMASTVLEYAWPVLSKMGRVFHLISYNEKLEQVENPRLKVVWEEANHRHIAMRQVLMLGTQTNLFEAQIQGTWKLFSTFPVPRKYQTNNTWPDDKYAFTQRLQQAHIATPISYSVSTFSQAKKAFNRLGVVCVKPRSGSNGRHTFPYVSNEKDLKETFYGAQKIGHFVIVEEQLEGMLVRATCVGGNLVGFLTCEYPSVVGDGHSTVEMLIKKQNQHKSENVSDIDITSLHQLYIARRGYHINSVLEHGVRLPLTYKAGIGMGGSNSEYGTAIHPGLKEEIERAARLTELPVVGFDLIIKDAQTSPQEQKWGIIEANSWPWIDLHAYPEWGKQINVASYIWDLWDKNKM